MAKMTKEEKYKYNNEYYKKNSLVIQRQRKNRKNTVVRGRMYSIYNNSKQRAFVKSMDFDISLDFLCNLWDKQEGKCALTGVQLSLKKEKARWNSNLVSLDRIDNDKGYLKNNVWLVTTKVNFAKGTQSYKDFLEMCYKVIEVSHA